MNALSTFITNGLGGTTSALIAPGFFGGKILPQEYHKGVFSEKDLLVILKARKTTIYVNNIEITAGFNV